MRSDGAPPQKKLKNKGYQKISNDLKRLYPIYPYLSNLSDLSTGRFDVGSVLHSQVQTRLPPTNHLRRSTYTQSAQQAANHVW